MNFSIGDLAYVFKEQPDLEKMPYFFYRVGKIGKVTNIKIDFIYLKFDDSAYVCGFPMDQLIKIG